MYTKQELIENKKLEKAIRDNKYRLRNKELKEAKEEKLETLLDRLFLLVFIPFMVYFIYQVVAYIYVRL